MKTDGRCEMGQYRRSEGVLKPLQRLFIFVVLATLAFNTGTAVAQQAENGLLKIGGFRCANLKKLNNSPSFDLYKTGDYNFTSFRQDVWRRLGVPFWYPAGSGAVRVAGPGWRPEVGDDISSMEVGGEASEGIARTGAHSKDEATNETHADSHGGEVNNLNDGDITTGWSPSDGKPNARISIAFVSGARVNMIRILSLADPEDALRDYSVGLILPDGSLKEIASVGEEHNVGRPLHEFPVPQIEAKGIYLDLREPADAKKIPTIYEFEAKGHFLVPPVLKELPSEVVIPMGGYAGEELHFIGNVGTGFPTTPDLETPVGQYVIHYENGKTENVPLVAGNNVADMRYGNFVPNAQFIVGLKPHEPKPGELTYHLDEMAHVEAEDQFMFFSHRLGHPNWPIQSVEFRCTRPRTMLMLAAVTLQQYGPRMNPLVYNGKMVRPYPADTPPAKPSALDTLTDRSRELSLDGEWLYATDPGNEGIRRQYFSPAYDASQWKTMAVPSQWFVKGLNYNGVVWFRRTIQVPASFPGSVAKLNFGAVDYDARIWLNGVYVGRHIGAYTSFKMNVTSLLHKGASNLLVVRVDSPIDPGYEKEKTIIKGNSVDDLIIPYGQDGSMGGIYRSVFLRAEGDVGIDDLWAKTKLSKNLKHADVQVLLSLENTASSGTVEVRATLLEPKRPGITPRSFTAAAIVKLTTAQIPVELGLSVDDPLLWYPWQQGEPYLHILKVEVLQNGQVLDRRYIHVGLRQIEFNEKGQYLLVNHHRIFLKGMVNDDIHWRSLMDRTGYAQRIQMQKDANLNIIRLIAHQSSPDFYDLCDEMGMMVWQEMPLQWGYSRTEVIRQDIKKVVRETVDQTRSHASVVGWSSWNEGGQPEFSDRVTSIINEEDGTRPVSLSSGVGESIHIYPTSFQHSLRRRTPLWIGLSLGFVSETGAYSIAPEESIREITGDDFLPFDSAAPLWDNFNSYRLEDGPFFLDTSGPEEWPKEKIMQYILAKIKPTARWFAQYQQSQYENARAQRFAPSTSLINCRFDDAFPLGFSGSVVTFTGRPKPAYYAVQAANRAVLPILFFDFHGAKDVRVVNDYWFRSWKGAKLSYRLTSRDGKVIRNLSRIFDLPPDSVVSVLNRDEAGDVWHVPGGFFADLTIRDSEGKLLSENHYDYTEEEVQTFVTSVYPLAPVKPINSVVLTAEQATATHNVKKRPSAGGTYSHELLETIDGETPQIEFTANVPEDSNYYIRLSANSGKEARKLELFIDGKKAELENDAGYNMDDHITRDNDYVGGGDIIPPISWYPGWQVYLSRGSHLLVFKVATGQPTPKLTLDAVSIQRYKPLADPYRLPAFAKRGQLAAH